MNISKKNRLPAAICAAAALIFFIKIIHAMPVGAERSFVIRTQRTTAFKERVTFLNRG
jgi:hypothetical protein